MRGECGRRRGGGDRRRLARQRGCAQVPIGQGPAAASVCAGQDSVCCVWRVHQRPESNRRGSGRGHVCAVAVAGGGRRFHPPALVAGDGTARTPRPTPGCPPRPRPACPYRGKGLGVVVYLRGKDAMARNGGSRPPVAVAGAPFSGPGAASVRPLREVVQKWRTRWGRRSHPSPLPARPLPSCARAGAGESRGYLRATPIADLCASPRPPPGAQVASPAAVRAQWRLAEGSPPLPLSEGGPTPPVQPRLSAPAPALSSSRGRRSVWAIPPRPRLRVWRRGGSPGRDGAGRGPT